MAQPLTLNAGQPVLTDPDWFVVADGEYAPDALVTCRRLTDASQECAFYALFIATGEYPA